MTVLADVIQALYNRRSSATPDSDLFANIGSFQTTAAETAAGAVPKNFTYPPGDSRRFSLDTTGTNNVTVTLQALLDSVGIAALDGEVREAILYPGTYLVNRLYMHYSNVYFRIMPGAKILQTLSGITNNRVTGQAPAYAIIHINPLTYVNNPASPITAISNVRIYGGGTINGPYNSTPGSYQQYVVGIASNDCNKCWIEEILVQGCGGESILLNGSAWNTCTDLRVNWNEINQGHEVGINNARAFQMLGNYMHDSWFGNGLGGAGDNGMVCFNRINNMFSAGMTIGGSGAADIAACRDMLIHGNVITNTGTGTSGGYALLLSDDGSPNPKNNLVISSNIIDIHTGPVSLACDYSTGTIEIIDNVVSGNTTAGANGQDFNVIAGSARYNLKGNRFNPGTGNSAFGVTVGSVGTPSVYVEADNNIYGHSTADINYSASIKTQGSLATSLTGFASTNVTITWSRNNKSAVLTFNAVTATSNATTMSCSISSFPAELLPARDVFASIVLTDNGTNGYGMVKVGTNGTVTFYKDASGNSANFTNTGTKGIPFTFCIAYPLD